MRKPLILMSLLLTAAVAWACGDKITLFMGARYSQVNPARRASILAYTHQTAASSIVIRDIQLQPALKKAGHRIQLIEDLTRLDDLLKTGNYDVVLADVTQADELSQRVRSAPSRPVVLPVAYKTSKAEQSAAQKKFHCLMKAPSDSEGYLAAIDQAMEWKAKALLR